MRERLERGRNNLAGAEAFVDGMRTAPAENPFQYRHDDITDDECDNRRNDKSDDNAVEAAHIELAGTGSREYRSSQRADKRVGGRRRNSEPPGNQVPDNRRDKRGGNNLKPVVELRRIGDASPIVFATPVKVNAPAKFITAAIRMATRGGKARVETDVAMAFAVSWKPLMKSNARARKITIPMTQKFTSIPI